MRVTIDRFEGNYAICETESGSMMNIEKNKVPVEAKEGDVLTICEDSISIDIKETLKRKKEIEELTKNLWE